MHLHSLFVQRFRNYKETSVEFNPSLNVICGPNAQGKTSLLEAIHYLMIGRSFRPCHNVDLIHIGSASFHLETIFCKAGVYQKLTVSVEDSKRQMIHNSTPLQSISNLLGIIPGVIMTPDDVNLVKGSPQVRRQFLDLQIAQGDPLYFYYLSRYMRAMRQRNQLLRQKKLATIESWEHEMAGAAAYIVMQRRRGIEDLQNYCQTYYAKLTEATEQLNLKYSSKGSNCQNESDLKAFHLHQFEKNRSREMAFGVTLAGPHKDDFWIGIDGRDVRYFASEGQQRSVVAALHLGEWQRLKQISEVTPLFMIDDVGISLDNQRKEKLLHELISLGQVFLTTTDTRLAETFSGSKKNILLPII